MVVGQDVMDVTGTDQLCAGQPGGCEAGVHAVRAMFQSLDCEAVLLVDASNAFNSLNRRTALLNILQLCPSIATILINC
uniref:Reverse transcriptase domain-containing protein n=1 Tax=Amphimedon queenslandica TaxID=400682 RepID=A0A1X7U8W6_AMPQE